MHLKWVLPEKGKNWHNLWPFERWGWGKVRWRKEGGRGVSEKPPEPQTIAVQVRAEPRRPVAHRGRIIKITFNGILVGDPSTQNKSNIITNKTNTHGKPIVVNPKQRSFVQVKHWTLSGDTPAPPPPWGAGIGYSSRAVGNLWWCTRRFGVGGVVRQGTDFPEEDVRNLVICITTQWPDSLLCDHRRLGSSSFHPNTFHVTETLGRYENSNT